MARNDTQKRLLKYKGLILTVGRDTQSEEGYYVFAKKEGDIDSIRTLPMTKQGDNPYYYVWMFKGEKPVPLHKIIYAFYCNWKSLDIQPDYEIHHINHSKDMKSCSFCYNSVFNLIYLPKEEHKRLHELEAAIVRDEATDEMKQEYLKTKNKYEYIRNNMIKKQLGIDVFNKLFENYEKIFYQYVKKCLTNK